MSVSYMRQDKILTPELAAKTNVHILGCGTVGSNVAVQMAKAGFGQFDIWDMDVIEAHNIPSQDYNVGSIGKPKTFELVRRVAEVNPAASVTGQGEVSDTDVYFFRGAVIMAVDNMELRAELFSAVRNSMLIDMFMDFRMGGKILQCWAFDPRDNAQVDKYKKTLYGSDDVQESVCGTRTFAPVGALSGVIATEIMTKYVMQQSYPFYTYVDLGSFTMQAMGMQDD